MPCVASKSDSLFLRQTCRLLVKSDSLHSHVKYWIGIHLRDYFPDMAMGPHAEIVSPYFQHMRLLLVEGLVLEDIGVAKLITVTAKALYEGYTTSFPPPKVIFKFNIDWQLVWDMLGYLELCWNQLGERFYSPLCTKLCPTGRGFSPRCTWSTPPTAWCVGSIFLLSA